jgi:hypothetical protein
VYIAKVRSTTGHLPMGSERARSVFTKLNPGIRLPKILLVSPAPVNPWVCPEEKKM